MTLSLRDSVQLCLTFFLTLFCCNLVSFFFARRLHYFYILCSALYLFLVPHNCFFIYFIFCSLIEFIHKNSNITETRVSSAMHFKLLVSDSEEKFSSSFSRCIKRSYRFFFTTQLLNFSYGNFFYLNCKTHT